MTNKPPCPLIPIPIPIPRTQDLNLVLVIVFKLLKELDGRDKSIKIVQYLLKILLHYNLVQKKTWSPTASNCSMTRKILRLGLAIDPARKLLFERGHSFKETCLLVNEVGNTVADDLFCLYKLGFVPASIGKQAEVVSNYCWLIGVVSDLTENYDTLQDLKVREKIDHEKIFMTHVAIAKLTMDGIVCASDIWQPPHADGVMVWAGFFSGSLAAYKLWKKVAASSS